MEVPKRNDSMTAKKQTSAGVHARVLGREPPVSDMAKTVAMEAMVRRFGARENPFSLSLGTIPTHPVRRRDSLPWQSTSHKIQPREIMHLPDMQRMVRSGRHVAQHATGDTALLRLPDRIEPDGDALGTAPAAVG